MILVVLDSQDLLGNQDHWVFRVRPGLVAQLGQLDQMVR